MKKLLLMLSAAGFLLLGACSKQEDAGNDQNDPVLKVKPVQIQTPAGAVYDKAKLDNIMISTLEAHNDFQ